MTRARPYNRDKALDAAQALFWRKGYHATSLKDLETALIMKPGSIYAAFESKENLFSLVLERYFVQNREMFVSSVDEAPSPLTGLVNFLRQFGQSNEQDPACRTCMLVKTLLNATEDEVKISQQAKSYIDQMEAEMAGKFERAKQLGEIPTTADVRDLAQRFQANITALRINAHRQIDDKELAFTADQMASELEALRIPPEEPARPLELR